MKNQGETGGLPQWNPKPNLVSIFEGGFTERTRSFGTKRPVFQRWNIYKARKAAEKGGPPALVRPLGSGDRGDSARSILYNKVLGRIMFRANDRALAFAENNKRGLSRKKKGPVAFGPGGDENVVPFRSE